MNWKPFVALFIGVLGVGTATAAQSPASGFGRDLAGAWSVQVTLRDCSTNTPLGPPFNSLVSFHSGGTLSESVGSTTFAPGQRTPGHGTWSRIGSRTYRQQMVNLLLFDTLSNLPPGHNPALPITPGFFAGWQMVTHTVVVNREGFSSSGTNAFHRSNGELYRTGCSTAVGRRIE
jgi:hypothetical protein